MIKPTTTLFLLSAITLAMSHFLFLEFYLYWRYLWLDIPMHFLGGITVALGLLSLRDFISWLPRWFFTLSVILSFTFAVAVLWEVFELFIGIPFEPEGYINDTIADLMLSMMGGLAGYFVGSRINTLG